MSTICGSALRRRATIAAVPAAVLVAFLAGACTIESEADAKARTKTVTVTAQESPVDARTYLLDADDFARIAGTTEHEPAARALLRFWRDVQFQNYPAAYLSLSAPLRRTVDYKRFVAAVAPARGLFLIKPRVEDEEQRGRFVIFNLALTRSSSLRQSDQVIGFMLTQEGRRWVIASDPYNLLAVEPPSA
jgi:hypothetical protein